MDVIPKEAGSITERSGKETESSAKTLHCHSMSTVCMHETVLSEVSHLQRLYTVGEIDLANVVHPSQEITNKPQREEYQCTESDATVAPMRFLTCSCHWALTANASPSMMPSHH